MPQVVTLTVTAPDEQGIPRPSGSSITCSDAYAAALVNDGRGVYVGGVAFLTPLQMQSVAAMVGNDGAVVALSPVIEETLATASATTTVTGAGTFAGYRCTTAAGNITVYDNTAASGKVLVPETELTVGSFPIYGAGHPGRVKTDTGVTVVLSGAAVVYFGAEVN